MWVCAYLHIIQYNDLEIGNLAGVFGIYNKLKKYINKKGKKDSILHRLLMSNWERN